jgi:hypothetical protein
MWIKIGYTNSGKTPAKDVRVAARAIQIPIATEIDFESFGPFRNIGPLGPGDERTKDVDIEVHSSCVTCETERPMQIHLFGRIDYIDEFDQKRWTKFHAYYEGRGVMRGNTLHSADSGNDYR